MDGNWLNLHEKKRQHLLVNNILLFDFLLARQWLQWHQKGYWQNLHRQVDTDSWHTKCTLTCSYHCWISQLMWLTWSIQDARYSNYCKCFVHLVSEESENKCCYNVVLIQSQIYLQNESNKEAIITTIFVPILQSLLQLHCWILSGLGTDLKVNTNLSLVLSLPV